MSVGLRNAYEANIRAAVRRSEFTQEVINKMAQRNDYARSLSASFDDPDEGYRWRTPEQVAQQVLFRKYRDLFFNEQEEWLKPDWLKEGKSRYKRTNYCRFVTNTYADLMVGGGAEIKTEYKVIDDYIEDEASIPMYVYKWVTMISALGCIGLQVVADNQGVDIMEVMPDILYPEFDEGGHDYKSISKKYFIDQNKVKDPSGRWQWTKEHDNKCDGIVFEECHYRGYINYYLYVVKDDFIIEMLPPNWYDAALPPLDPESGLCQVETGVSDFMLMIIPNVLIMKKYISDYDDIIDHQSSLNARNTQIARVLNIHADPKLMLPTTMQQSDPFTGKVTVRGLRDEVLFIDPEDNAVFVPQYLTWQAQLEEAYKEADRDIDAILTMSQISAALVVRQDTGATFPESAVAYKMKLTPTLNRIKVKQGDFKKYLKRLLAVFINKLLEKGEFDQTPDVGDISQAEGAISETRDSLSVNTRIKPRDIDIEMLPAIPQDERFLVERAGGLQTASVERILKEVDGMSDRKLKEELAAIKRDEETSMEAFGSETDGLKFGDIETVPETQDGGLNAPPTGRQTAGLTDTIN